MLRPALYPVALAALLLAGCHSDKAPEAGTQGMNAAADQAADSARANPTIDNPYVASETDAPNPDAPVMTFAEQQFDFGDLRADTVVRHTFKFTNTGKTPLLIVDALAFCGCTTPSWPRGPVAPGATGELQVQFNSHGRHGLLNKQVTVRANTQPATTTLYIKGNVAGE